MSLNLPPIPSDQIGESPIWRNWFTRLQKGLTSSTPGTIPVNHNGLSAIQGGIPTERYHLTAADVSKLAGIAAGAEVNVINSASSTTSISLAVAIRNLTATVLPAGVDHAQLGNINSVSYTHLTSAEYTAMCNIAHARKISTMRAL